MAVPKKKTTPSKGGMRRSHNALKCINGGLHRVGDNGLYRGKEIIKQKVKSADA